MGARRNRLIRGIPGLSRVTSLAAGPLAFLLVWALVDLATPARLTLASTAWIATWWVLEALPIPVTSLLPLVLLPLLGLRSAKDVAGLYMNDLIFLLLGGFLLAFAVERWGLHRRVALFVLRRVGTSPRRLVLGFLLAAAVLSMWISNTATTLMLLPIALAVVRPLAPNLSVEARGRLELALLLSVAYGANLGGLGTYLGTPPNLIFRERYAADFGAGQPGGPPEITFLQWFLAFAPMVLLFLPILWAVLSFRLPRGSDKKVAAHLQQEVDALPPWSSGQVAVAVVFGITALLWITREPLPVGDAEWFGWGQWFLMRTAGDAGPPPSAITDGTIALAMATLCFLLRTPSRPPDAAEEVPDVALAEGPSARQPWEPLLRWREAERQMPWGILLLFGGGFALGDTFKTSGLSEHLGQALADRWVGMPTLGVMATICLLVTFLTEVTSNTATTNVILPILAGVAPDLGVSAPVLLLPATLSASCAFMLPVATAPNAIVFATGRVPIRKMLVRGIGINLMGVVFLSLWLHYVALPFLGVD